MKMFKIVIKLFLSVILIVTTVYTVYLLKNLGLTYNKYILLLIIVLCIISLLLITGVLFVKKIVIKVFIYIFYLIITVSLVVIIFYLSNTLNFVNSFGHAKKSYDYYHVIVNIDSKYHSIENLDGKIIGNTSNVSDDILNKLDINITSNNYDSLEKLYDDLKNNKIDAFVVSDAEAYLLEEQKNENFTKNIRVLKTIKVKKELEQEEQKLLNDSFIMYISGIDTSGSISKVSRSDVNILVTVNTNTHQILLSSIPRDYYVQLHGTTGYKDKLTHAGIYGIDMSISTIEDLIETKIDYYIRVNFDTLIKLIDSIGDIEIYSDKDLSFCDIKEGYNTLNSKCALRFARERKSYETGDRHRGKNQEEILNAIINKIGNSKILLTKYDDILKSLEGNFDTNITSAEIKNIIKIQSKDMPHWDINTYNLDGYGEYNYTYSYPNLELYVMEADMNTVNSLKNYIKVIFDGKKYNEISDN